jgi:hypothetical protein
MMIFQGPPYDDEAMEENIIDMVELIGRYDPTLCGYAWPPELASRFQLSPPWAIAATSRADLYASCRLNLPRTRSGVCSLSPAKRGGYFLTARFITTASRKNIPARLYFVVSA